MASTNMLVVGGVILPNPSSYSRDDSDIDSSNSKRSESGILNREVVRAGVKTITASWDNLRLSQLRSMLQAVSGVSLEVTFFDITATGTTSTATMYVSGAKTYDIYLVNKDDLDDSRCKITLTFTEY